MSFPTQPAFVVHAQGWDEALLQHPLMKFLWEHEQLFDAKKHDECAVFYQPDIVYKRANGMVLTGQDAIQGFIQEYSLFKEYFREFCSVSFNAPLQLVADVAFYRSNA